MVDALWVSNPQPSTVAAAVMVQMSGEASSVWDISTATTTAVASAAVAAGVAAAFAHAAAVAIAPAACM